MAVWVVYESMHGNTEKIAQAVGKALGSKVKVTRVAEASSSQIKGVDLLVVGSPTYGGKQTPGVLAFLNSIPAGALKGVRVAAFDTRITWRFLRLFGFAAEKTLAALVAKGGTRAGEPRGFFVRGSNGPLADGEIEKAAAWAKGL